MEEGLEPEPASLQTNNQTMKPHVNPVKLKNAQLIETKVKEGKIQVNLKCFNSYVLISGMVSYFIK